MYFMESLVSLLPMKHLLHLNFCINNQHELNYMPPINYASVLISAIIKVTSSSLSTGKFSVVIKHCCLSF